MPNDVSEPGVHELEELLDGLVPSLVGRRRDGERCDAVRPRGRLPVLRVAGEPGTGKSALLETLRESYGPWVPLVRVDCGDERLGQPALRRGADTLETSDVSPVTSLLYVFSDRLTARADRSPLRIVFPRLLTGLLLVSAWQTEEDGLAPAALRQAQSDLEAHLPERGAKFRKALLAWLTTVLGLLPGLIPGFPQPGTFDELRVLITRQLEHPDKGALDWWYRQLSGYQGDGLRRLVDSVWDFRRGGERRYIAEARLVAAFLADVCEHYGTRARLAAAGRPLVLLDNTHSALGERFLALLTEAAGTVPEGQGWPVVVATALGRSAAHPTPSAAAACLSDERLVTCGMPALTDGDIRVLLRAVPDHEDELPHLVHRFGQGRRGCTHTLVTRAVRAHREGGTVRGRDLLDLTGPELLAALLPDAGLRDTLTVLSAARDRAAAERLWHQLRPEDDAGARVEQAERYLRERCLDGDPAVGVLLEHALLRDPRRERVHLILRAGCNPRNREEYEPGHEDGYLFHTLALGRLEPVVRALHHRYATGDPTAWLASVDRLCAAPRPPVAPDPGPADAGEVRPCPACPAGENSREHWAVRRLVGTVWELSAPDRWRVDERELDAVHGDLEILHGGRGGADTIYREAARRWRDRLAKHHQAPYLNADEEGTR
ncbi:hypothetical protein [Streptomyces sp. NPDC001020]